MPLPWIGAGIAAGGSVLGQYLANEAQKKLSREQMLFQERMSSTAWRRGVRDMKLAGINPALAYMKGGASSPGGQMAQVKDVIGPAVSSAMGAMRLKQEIKNMKATEYATKMQGAHLNAQIHKLMLESGILSARDHPGAESWKIMQERIRVQIMGWERELLKAGYDRASIRGSKVGGVMSLLFGGGGSLNPMTWGRSK